MLKKWILTLVLLLVLPNSVLAQDIPERPTTAGYVFDFQNVIDDAIEEDINEIARRLQEDGKMELMIVTVPTIGELEPYEYGLKFFREWGIGDEELNNGLLIYVTTEMGKGNNVVRISTGYGLEERYPDSETDWLIQTYMKESLSDGDYTTAFANVVDAIREIEGIEYTWVNDVSTINGNESVNESEESETTLFEKISSIIGTIIVIIIFLGVLGIGLLYIWVIAGGIFRRLQGLFYTSVSLIFKKDIRSKGYLRYLEEKEAAQKKLKKRKSKAGVTSDPFYHYLYDNSSSDNYSYGSGDSGGGGSDDRF